MESRRADAHRPAGVEDGAFDGHDVQFYGGDAFLAGRVCEFLLAGLEAADGVVVIATRAHADELRERLAASGVDVAAAERDRLVFADADETLAHFFVDGRLDPARFRERIGRLVERVGAASRPVRAFGEMVDLLWKQGRRDAALDLERLWNELRRETPLALLCAYSLAGFEGSGDEVAFEALCRLHGAVGPTERAPDVARLDQRARALEAEVRRRVELEAALEDSRRRYEERLEAEARLRESEMRLRLLIESIRDYAVFMLDPYGRVASWNPGAERIKGYSAKQILGQHFSIFYPQDDVRAGKCELELRVARDTGRFEDEGWRVRRDGTRFWANVVISAVRGEDGALLGFSKVTRDLTERKRAEEERARLAAVEQANRAKDEFLAMLGHELRNPLAPIVTALELMKLKAGPAPTREQAIIERHVQHLARLVDDLLDVARISQGKVELRHEPVDLAEVVARSVEATGARFDERRVRLQVDVCAGGLEVEGDPVRLAQVVTNLLTNAARYGGDGGTVLVTAAREGGEVVVRVVDDGIGIPDTLRPRIFDLFVQGERSTGHAEGGLGIGLAVVRRLVQLHGGRVEARSDGPGRGSTFEVRLPAARRPSLARRDDARSPAPPLGGRRVLIVDDQPDAPVLLAELCATFGHDARVAHGPHEALGLAAEFAPEVAVLDLGLPVMDGCELARRLRAQQGAGCRLIALTGYGQDGDRDRTREAGFERHLVKPVDPMLLLRLLDDPAADRPN